LGAQDSHYKLSGAFTGDTSSELLKYFNCEYVILGHSERRQYHNETYNTVKQKILTAVSVKIKPIICVGETLDERKKKNYKKVIEDQLEKCIPTNLKEVIIAYEPIWSIGTGIIPKYSEIEEISNIIYEFLKKKKIRPKILYGGSVNKKNFKNIITIKNICGGLIGGASLNPHELIEMIEKV
ncbi:MAG: triose-phosphate isomerase, partial [Rickettsiales bacterium]|nr:triose-phosphate isomerase [Rickettsiales bacterium]